MSHALSKHFWCNHVAFTNPASCKSRPSWLLPHPTCKMLESKSFPNTFIKYLGRNREAPSSTFQPGKMRPESKHCIKLSHGSEKQTWFLHGKERKNDFCMQIFLTMTCSSRFMSFPRQTSSSDDPNPLEIMNFNWKHKLVVVVAFSTHL